MGDESLCSFDGRPSVLSLVALILWPKKLRANVADSQEVWVPTPHQGCGAEDTTRLPRVVSSSCADWHPFIRVPSNKRQLLKYTHTLSSFYLQMSQHRNVLGHHQPQSCVSLYHDWYISSRMLWNWYTIWHWKKQICSTQRVMRPKFVPAGSMHGVNWIQVV